MAHEEPVGPQDDTSRAAGPDTPQPTQHGPTGPAQPPTPRGIQQRYPWLMSGLVLVIGLALIVGAVLAQSGSSQAPTAPTAQQTSVPQPAPPQGSAQPSADFSHVERRDPQDLLADGPVDAPVALVIYSDYQCPYCARWSHDTLPALLPFVESGDLRIEWRDVNIFGEPSENAARATLAAAMQDRMWDYHDALFADGATRQGAELERDGLIALADELGLDPARFASDFDSDAVIQQIRTNADEGRGIGVASTPSFLLGGRPIVGAQPTEVFLQALQEALGRPAQ